MKQLARIDSPVISTINDYQCIISFRYVLIHTLYNNVPRHISHGRMARVKGPTVDRFDGLLTVKLAKE